MKKTVLAIVSLVILTGVGGVIVLIGQLGGSPSGSEPGAPDAAVRGTGFSGNIADADTPAKIVRVGELAPTFKLGSLDGSSTFDLAASRGKRPVVLFFGSYT